MPRGECLIMNEIPQEGNEDREKILQFGNGTGNKKC
jgi:hypothetical protein